MVKLVYHSKRFQRSCKSQEYPRHGAENRLRSRLALHNHQIDVQRLFIDMASTLAKPSPHTHQTSRPTSASSSSVVTVQRATSFSSHNGSGPRAVITGLRTRSPNENTLMNSHTSRSALSPGKKRRSPETTRRSSAYYTRPDSKHGTSDGNANLNRWSQSTTSSRKSSATHQRRSSFSKRLSGSIGSFAGFGSPQGPSPTGVLNRRPRSPNVITPPTSTIISPLLENPPPTLPPIVTLSSLSQAVEAAESPSTVSAHTPATADLLSASTNNTSEPDYFGDRWLAKSPSKPVSRGRRTSSGRLSSRTSVASPRSPDRPLSSWSGKPPESVFSSRAAPSLRHVDRRQGAQHRYRANSAKSTGTTEGESSASDNRDLSGRAQRRRAPSQKALLSKALAKANHAVVLDGKQNVEGAILAYGDACNLLRQVMVRSPGEDDRRKLEAVVSSNPSVIASTVLLTSHSGIPTRTALSSSAAVSNLINPRTTRLYQSAL